MFITNFPNAKSSYPFGVKWIQTETAGHNFFTGKMLKELSRRTITHAIHIFNAILHPKTSKISEITRVYEKDATTEQAHRIASEIKSALADGGVVHTFDKFRHESPISNEKELLPVQLHRNCTNHITVSKLILSKAAS